MQIEQSKTGGVQQRVYGDIHSYCRWNDHLCLAGKHITEDTCYYWKQIHLKPLPVADAVVLYAEVLYLYQNQMGKNHKP